MRKNLVKELWKKKNGGLAGGYALNGWLAIPNSFSAEVMANLGWDSLVIDI